MRARRLATALSAVAVVAGMTACEKPTPLVSVVSGTSSVDAQAGTYCFEGQDINKPPGTAGACRVAAGAQPAKLEVRRGKSVGIDVSKMIADKGWRVVLKGSGTPDPATGTRADEQTDVLDEHYFTFTPNVSSNLQVEVYSLESDAQDAKVTGVWQFELVPS